MIKMSSITKKAKVKGIMSVKKTMKLLRQEMKSQEEKLKMIDWKRRVAIHKRNKRYDTYY